jgi:hypothetical protein
LVDGLPEDATWDDVLEQVYLRHLVAEGLKAGAEGRTRTLEEVRKHFLLTA